MELMETVVTLVMMALLGSLALLDHVVLQVNQDQKGESEHRVRRDLLVKREIKAILVCVVLRATLE